jgi:iron complex outermembrane receptor protein
MSTATPPLRTLRHRLISSVAATAAVFAAGQAAAQASVEKREAPELEEIVVTGDLANKFGTNVVQAGSFRGAQAIDTPQTVAVVSSAVLKSQQAIELMDALRNTAGVASTSNGPAVYNNVTIRGITVDTRSNFKLNGSLNILSSVAFPLENKERVEVLKGASALYYGFSAPSGIVNLTTKRPTQDFYASVNTFADNHGGVGGAVDLGDSWGPFGARLNGVYAHLDNGVRYSTGRRYLISGAFDLRPTDKLTLTLDVERFGKRIVEPATFRFTRAPVSTPTDPYPKLTLPPLLSSKANFGTSWADNDADETNILGKATYKFSPAWELTVSGGQSKLHRIRFLPTLNPTNLTTGEGVLTVSPQNARFKNVNYGVELAGAFATGPFEHELLIGASRAQKDSKAPTAIRRTFAQNFLNPINIPDPGIKPPPPTSNTPVPRIEDNGYYVFDRIKYGEWLQLLGGLRQSDYTESDASTGMETYHATPLSYSYGVVIKPKSWMSLYGAYIQGLESSGLAPSTANNSGEQLPPAESTQKELGFKLEPRKGLLIQAAYFDIKRGSTYINADNVFVLDGEARFRGTEVSLAGEVTDELSLYASAMFLTAKQTSGAPTIRTATTFSPTAVGLRIEATPGFTASVAGEYDLSRFVDGLKVTAGFYHVGKQAVNALNQAFIPAYTTYDLGASYTREIGDHQFTFRLNGQNVTGKKYWASTGGLFLGQSLPQTIKFSVSATY